MGVAFTGGGDAPFRDDGFVAWFDIDGCIPCGTNLPAWPFIPTCPWNVEAGCVEYPVIGLAIPELAANAAAAAAALRSRRRRIIPEKKKVKRPMISNPPIVAPTAMPAFAPWERDAFLAGTRLYLRVKRCVDITWTACKDWRFWSIVGTGPDDTDVKVATSRWLMLSVVDVASSKGVVV